MSVSIGSGWCVLRVARFVGVLLYRAALQLAVACGVQLLQTPSRPARPALLPSAADAKRVKRENGWAPGVKAEVAAEGVELEALGLGGLKPEQQQQQQQEAAAAEAAGEVLWEDVKEEQAAAEDGGEADEADEADEWEDI